MLRLNENKRGKGRIILSTQDLLIKVDFSGTSFDFGE
jgi:hypothetical protein